jgi:hypothetical protein
MIKMVVRVWAKSFCFIKVVKVIKMINDHLDQILFSVSGFLSCLGKIRFRVVMRLQV